MTAPNIIMVVLDGLRRDRLNLCQHLMSVAKNNYFFSNMITAAPYTFGSMHATFSGIYPSKNGVNAYYNMFKFKKDECKTLPQYLKQAGYITWGDVNSKCIVPAQGFDKLNIFDEHKYDLKENHKKLISEASKHKKFFLYLHYIRLHTYVVEEVGKKHTDFDEVYFNSKEKNIKRYNSHLKEMDDYVNSIFTHIDSLNLRKNTVVLFLSDHGISNGERIGEKMYGSFLYNYTTNVFSVLCLPEGKGKIPFLTRTVDIFPTLLDLTNISLDASQKELDGKSLIPYINGTENDDRVAFAETGGLSGPWPSPKKHNVFCAIKNEWKLIYNETPKTYELYNITEDPEEQSNLVDTHKEPFEDLKTELMKELN